MTTLIESAKGTTVYVGLTDSASIVCKAVNRYKE